MAGYPRKLLSLELALKNIIKELKKDEIKKMIDNLDAKEGRITEILIRVRENQWKLYI